MYTKLIKPFLQDSKKFILDTLFPILCLSCEKEGDFICADCKSLIKKLEHQRCIVCQKPTPFGLTHPGCQTPHGADGLISFYDYHDDKVSNIIIKGKYSFLPGVYKILGAMIADSLRSQYPNLSPEVLTKGGILISNNIRLAPIPLHPWRRRWRGFNQAEVLCQTLSAKLNLPVVDVLIRKKITKTQKDLKKDQRLKNVDGAFSLSPKILNHKSEILNRNFILVDDVTTTGATLQEAAKVLKRNGAAKVICLTVARD